MHLPGLWLGPEHVLKGKGVKTAEGGAWGVIIVATELELRRREVKRGRRGTVER